MKHLNCDYSLYLVTDRDVLKGRDLYQGVKAALQGGVTLVQLREKDLSARDFYQMALVIKELTTSYGVPLLINDRLDIALAVEAEGVHIGQDDLPLPEVRRILGSGKLLGYSVSNIAEAKYGAAHGVDYLGAGPVYATTTKATDLTPLGVLGLKAIKEAVSVAVVGIGGINAGNVWDVKQAGVAGISVVSGILGSEDPETAARELLQAFIGHSESHNELTVE